MINIAIYQCEYKVAKMYCDEYHINYKIYNEYNDLLKYAHQYHIILTSKLIQCQQYGIKYKCVSINNNISTLQLHQYIIKCRPKLFDNINIYNKNIIPKIIHFMWLDKENKSIFPQKYEKNIETFKQFNRKYDIKIWYIKEVTTLIKNNLPEFYDIFMTITPWISKCDFARFCIIYILGGVYSDCDFYCMKPLDNLICNHNQVFINEPHATHHIFNGFFASIPKTKFIYGWLQTMSKHIKYKNVMDKTGPLAFGRYYQSSNYKPKLIENYKILPYKYQSNLLNNQYLDDIYVYTLWHEGCGWENDQINEWIYGFIFLFLIIIITIITTIL